MVWLWPIPLDMEVDCCINLGDWGLVPANPFPILKFQLLGVLRNFPTTTWQTMTGPHSDLSLAHVTTLHKHPHHLYHIILPRHLSSGCMVFHVVVWISTWNIPIGPRIWPKKSKTLVTCGSFWCCHIIMITSGWHVSPSVCATYIVRMMKSYVLMLALAVRMLTHPCWLV